MGGKRKRKTRRKPEHEAFIKQLDEWALICQKDPSDEKTFQKICDALNKFIVGQAFHRFIIRGKDGMDLYQESLIVLWQKAIPSFDPERGMSFWGFAKMCISRHLITILNSALNRKKDIPMNRSISLDEVLGDESEGDDGCCLHNLFDDGTDFLKDMCSSEDRTQTVNKLRDTLSPFESIVLYYYLEEMSYKEIAISISEVLGRKCNEKSVDNALLRIRRKASDLLGDNELPLFT